MLRHSTLLLQQRKASHLLRCRQNGLFSTTTTLTTTTSTSSSIPDYEPVIRHGRGDGVITVNVGGTQFKTLQSTIQASPVLCETIARARANGEMVDQNIIFVDRDPTHFPLILTYLRNKTEGIAYNNKIMKQTVMGVTRIKIKSLANRPQYVRLPQDQGQLQDLFVESVHYGLTDLQDQLCHTSIMVTIMSWFGGGNPFQQANEALKAARRTLLALAGTGGIVAAMKSELAWLQEKFGFLVTGNKEKKESDVVGDGKPAEPSLA
jgi:hypothetical protein